MAYWESSTNWSLAVNLDDLAASILFPLAKWKTAEVEIFLEQSRFSNSQHGKVIHRAFVLVRAPNLQILKSNKEVRPGSIKALRYAPQCCYHSVRHSTPSFLVLLPLTIDYLDRWAPSSSVSRPYDAMTSLYHRFPQPYSRHRDRVSWPCRAPCWIHQITLWVNWPLQPRIGYKTDPFTRNRRYESSISVKARQYHYSCSSPS
jgi:hypothetical protein